MITAVTFYNLPFLREIWFDRSCVKPIDNVGCDFLIFFTIERAGGIYEISSRTESVPKIPDNLALSFGTFLDKSGSPLGLPLPGLF